MADVNINIFTNKVYKQGASTVVPGFIEGEEPTPINPSGSGGASEFVPYVGATENFDLGEFGLSAGFLKLDTTPTNTPTDQGTMYWDEDDNTVDIILNGYIMKVGEDLFYPVKNQTGSSIAKGTNVGFAGTLGSSGRLLITPYLANGANPTSRYMGVTAETIANGDDGKVLWFGRIRGINTNAFNEGDILYASTSSAGAFQTTLPVAPNNIVEVAAVVNKSSTNGVIFVRPQFLSSASIGGSGTTNYVPRFTGATTIGNSQIIDNGTNVLINTTTDSGDKVNLNGNIKIGDANTGTLKATKELVLRQDGDFFGSSILRLRNRPNEAGAIYEITNLEVIDFILKTPTIQRNIRLENRDTFTIGSAPEWQIGGTILDPTLRIANNEIILNNGKNIRFNTGTGTKIGTATTQKLAFWNATPIVQPSGDIVTALQNLGLVASPTISGLSKWTDVTGGIYRNSRVLIGSTSFTDSLADLEVKGRMLVTDLTYSSSSTSTVSSNTTLSIDMTFGVNLKRYVLEANLTINFSANLSSGTTSTYTFVFKQDGTGGRTVTWNTTGVSVLWQGGVAPIISVGANEITVITIMWTGEEYLGVKSCGFNV
jgi:hypothetical protein